VRSGLTGIDVGGITFEIMTRQIMVNQGYRLFMFKVDFRQHLAKILLGNFGRDYSDANERTHPTVKIPLLIHYNPGLRSSSKRKSVFNFNTIAVYNSGSSPRRQSKEKQQTETMGHVLPG
jgi:hypothetical protein